jgi:hypothetical protein
MSLASLLVDSGDELFAFARADATAAGSYGAPAIVLELLAFC